MQKIFRSCLRLRDRKQSLNRIVCLVDRYRRLFTIRVTFIAVVGIAIGLSNRICYFTVHNLKLMVNRCIFFKLQITWNQMAITDFTDSHMFPMSRTKVTDKNGDIFVETI
ncbi:hypothetical protein T4B_12710 [Trichinella pseudospiralis]|uniref:Uncharacterized protein n=1 Tax=Trichinella pseudospiralis TaxID=6337 RepID=A0A0V1IVC0_TRIPS|nr:hypothetical protein T4B_12710 [Trichinella pseudospiralis]KRZ26659.1 hypothetical protein T4C_11331 [Trichinella pseudospiralis]